VICAGPEPTRLGARAIFEKDIRRERELLGAVKLPEVYRLKEINPV
jgi:hypothetical protein